MAYTKTNWQNLPNQTTPINATNLNHIEQGIYDATYGNGVNVSNEVDEDYRVNLIKSVNLIDSNNFKGGTYAITTGEWAEYGTRICTINKIPVKPSTKYSITINTTTSYNFLMIIDAYSESGAYLGRITANNGYASGYTAETQATAKYINITIRDTTDTQVLTATYYQYLSNGSLQIQLVEGDTALPYEPFTQNSMQVDGTKFTDTINVGQLDSRSRVNVLKSKNLLDLQFLQLITNSSGTVISNNSYWDVIVDTRNISSLYVSGNFSLLSDNTIRVGTYSSYPVLGSTGTRITLQANGAINTSNVNYVLFAFGMASSSVTIDQVKASFMINEGSTALPYEVFIPNQIVVDNEKYSETIGIGTSVDNRNRVNVLYLNTKISTGNLEQGGFTNTGLPQNNATRVRSASFISTKPNTSYSVKVPSTMKVGVKFYNTNTSTSESVGETTGWVNEQRTFTTPSNANYIKFIIGKQNDANITPSEVTFVQLKGYITPSIYVDGEEIYSKPVVLWQNSSPTSAFSNQSVSLSDNLTNYKYYEIIYIDTKSSSIYFSTGRLPYNAITYLTIAIQTIRRRYTEPRGTTMMFASAEVFSTYGGSATTNNDNLIPYQILGYK